MALESSELTKYRKKEGNSTVKLRDQHGFHRFALLYFFFLILQPSYKCCHQPRSIKARVETPLPLQSPLSHARSHICTSRLAQHALTSATTARPTLNGSRCASHGHHHYHCPPSAATAAASSTRGSPRRRAWPWMTGTGSGRHATKRPPSACPVFVVVRWGRGRVMYHDPVRLSNRSNARERR